LSNTLFPHATPAEIVATLRKDADDWVGLGELFADDSDDDGMKRNAARVTYLRAAAKRIEALEKMLREARSICERAHYDSVEQIQRLLNEI
jgi:hypothetical protein